MDERTATAIILAEENLRRGEAIHHAIIDTHSRIISLERKFDVLIAILKQEPSCEKNPADISQKQANGSRDRKNEA